MTVATEDPRERDDRTSGQQRRAFLEEIFDRHHDIVYRFCLARTGSHDAAEEATSDTFTDAARRVAAGGAADVTEGWLITVARRRIIDRWRANERHRSRLERLFTMMPTKVDPPEPRDEATLRALRSLPERQRAALALRYLDGYSVSEVAEALDCPYRAAESLLSRARRSFAQSYHEEMS